MNIMKQLAVLSGTSVNLVAGSAFEYPQQPAQVSAGVNQSVTGGFVTIYAGSRLIAEEFIPRIVAAYPVVPDDFYFNFLILPAERLSINFRNPTGGGITAWLAIDMQPVGR